MHYLEQAREHLSLDNVKEQVGKVLGAASGAGGSQTVTIARPRAQVEQFWRDPEKLSAVFGEVADVRTSGSGAYQWTLHRDGDESVTWNTVLVTEGDALRFAPAPGDDSAIGEGLQISIEFSDAPVDLGTEVTLRAKTPLPDFLVGAAAFQALYRARALLQTGEMPSLAGTPSARATTA